MKKKTIIFACIIALVLITTAIAQTNKISLAEVKDCKTVEWETEEPVYGTCTQETLQTVCTDEPKNESCQQQTLSQEYSCQTGTKTVEHSEEVCEPKAIEITKEFNDVITEKGRINFKEWGKCSYEKEEIICDSKFDGNNDGICQSGESCIKFVITANGVKRYVKNSRDDFVEEDSSFFLEKLEYEVER